MSTLKSNYQKILSLIAGRAQLIAVSKTHPIEKIQALYELGQRDFGENRVQELVEKSQALAKICPEIRWHMIGPLQSNKINQLFNIKNLYAIHSIDRLELLEKLNKKGESSAVKIKVFIQVNTSGEIEKHGFNLAYDVSDLLNRYQNSSVFKIVGFMTMATVRTEDKSGQARTCFAELKAYSMKYTHQFADPIQLSMGMSDDFEYALENSTNWVRIGSALFTE